VPRFAAVVCEDIERSARDTFNALKLEKALSREGIPLFATDEPAAIEGANAASLAAAQAATPDASDPALLDQLPFAAGIFGQAPARIQQAILAALQVQGLYNNDDHQVTIRATLTSGTPRAIAALLADPRTDDDSPAGPATSTDAFSHSGSTPKPRVYVHDNSIMGKNRTNGPPPGFGAAARGERGSHDHETPQGSMSWSWLLTVPATNTRPVVSSTATSLGWRTVGQARPGTRLAPEIRKDSSRLDAVSVT
jgi:hypothetical protein